MTRILLMVYLLLSFGTIGAVSASPDSLSDSDLVAIAVAAANAGCGPNIENRVRVVQHDNLLDRLVVRFDNYWMGIPMVGDGGLVHVNRDGTIPYADVHCRTVEPDVNFDSIIPPDSAAILALGDTLHEHGNFECSMSAYGGGGTWCQCSFLCMIPPCCPPYRGQAVRSIRSELTLAIYGKDPVYQLWVSEWERGAVHILTPNGNQSYASGDTLAVRWTADTALVESCYIDISVDTAETWLSVSGPFATAQVGDTAMFAWSVPDTLVLDGDFYTDTTLRFLIRVRSAPGSSSYDISDDFSDIVLASAHTLLWRRPRNVRRTMAGVSAGLVRVVTVRSGTVLRLVDLGGRVVRAGVTGSDGAWSTCVEDLRAGTYAIEFLARGVSGAIGLCIVH